MNDIDFLPQDYVCVQTKRNKSNWLRGLLAVVLVLIAVGWVTQHRSMSELAARRDRMRDQAIALLARVEPPDALKSELARQLNNTRLVDALRSQIPPSRWMAAIVDVLPPQTMVSEIRAEIDDGTAVTTRIEQPSAVKSNEAAITDPVELDLNRLAPIVQRRSLVISIRGIADDDLEISRFLNGLHRNDQFERVQLLFTDQQVHRNRAVRSFAIRIHTASLAGKITQQTPSSRSAGAVAVRSDTSTPNHSTEH